MPCLAGLMSPTSSALTDVGYEQQLPAGMVHVAASPNDAAAAAAGPSQHTARAPCVTAGLTAPQDDAVEHIEPSQSAEPSQPGSDLLEILKELCRERELDFEAIDSTIRVRLAAVPNSMRFRPGYGAGEPVTFTFSMNPSKLLWLVDLDT